MADPTGAPYLEAGKLVGLSYVLFDSPIQTFTMNRGKRNITDQFVAGTATVQGIKPSLLPSLNIGDIVRLTLRVPKTGGNEGRSFFFRVADLQLQYGITANQDTWTLYLEDSLATVGRALLPTTSWTGGVTANAAATTVVSNVGLSLTEFGTSVNVSANTVTGSNASQVMNQLANTDFAWLEGQISEIVWKSRTYWLQQSSFATFADDGTGLKYNQLQFNNFAQNYSNNVIVEPVGLAAQQSGTGTFSYTVNTYNQNTTDASNLAGFVQNILAALSSAPSAMSFLVNGQTIPDVLDAIFYGNAIRPLSIKFRGTTLTCRAIGFAVSGDPQQTRATLYLLPEAAVQFLLLDNAVFGKLDTNKLGW